MGGGGKTAQSSSQIQIPPEVLARYNAVNTRAEDAASTPFQQYSTDPNKFVAPLNETQNAGIAGTNAAANSYQPYYDSASSALGAANTSSQPLLNSAAGNITSGQATGQNYLGAATGLAGSALGAAGGYNNAAASLTGQSAGAVNPTALGAAQINQFMSPYNESVVQSTMANLRQQQQQEQSSEVGNQIKAGAFGGDRGGIAQANLARQQDLASGQVLSGLYNQNYQQALGAAQQQQGVGLSAAQANRSALGAAGQQFAGLGQNVYGQTSGTAGQIAGFGQQGYDQALGAANAQSTLGGQNFSQGLATSQQQAALGSGVQQAGLAGAQAQIGAGTVAQQTTQAGQSALYNQFLQQQGYPFQVAQFLAGIAEGTGSLSGSTTTSTQPTSFLGGLSDARMKEDMEPVGETYDGQKIVRFRYKGEKEKKLGLVAQNVEHVHPDAVREQGGLKYVDYDRATDKAAARGHFAGGGGVGDDTMAEVARIQKAMYPWGSEAMGRTGGGTGPWGSTLPQGNFKLAVAEAPKMTQTSGLHELAGVASDVGDLKKTGDEIYDDVWGKKKDMDTLDNAVSAGATSNRDFYRGGIVRMKRAAGGGMPYENIESYVPEPEKEARTLQTAKAPEIKQGGLLGDLKDIASVAKTAAMFASRGGLVTRKHYADGGDVNVGDLEDADSGDHTFGHDVRSIGSGLGKAWNWSADHITRPTFEYFSGKKFPSQSEAPVAQATEPPPPVKERAALGAASYQRPSPIQDAGIVPIRPEPKVVHDEETISPPSLGAADTSKPDVDSLQGGNKEPMPKNPEKRPGWFSRNQDWIVPVLKGLEGAASAQTAFAPVAILKGLGAGAGAYEDVQNQIVKREATEAGTSASYQGQLPQALRGWMQVAKDPTTGRVKTNANGTPMYVMTDVGSGDQPGQGVTPSDQKKYVSYYDPDTKSFVYDIGPSDATDKRMAQMGLNYNPNTSLQQRMINAKRAIAMSNNADQEAVSEKNYADRRTALPEIENQHKQLLLMADQMGHQPQEGLGAPGAGHGQAAQVIGMVNWAARAMGLPPSEALNGSETADQIMNKVAAWTGSQAANIQGQHSMHVAEVLRQNLPNALMTPDAQREMMASLLRASQMDRDIVKYGEQQKNKYGTLLNYENNFKEDLGPELDKEHNVINNWMRHPEEGKPINPKKPDQSLFGYLMENRDRFTPEDKLKLAKMYGPSALRWLDIH